MSSWYEGILEINDVEQITYNRDNVYLTLNSINIDYYTKYFKDCIVFRYIYISTVDSIVNILKDTFLLHISLRNDNKVILSFYYHTQLSDDELRLVNRGIKMNKIKKKMESTK